MAYNVSKIPAAHREFASQVCKSLWEGSVGRQKGGFIEPEYIYADGTESPNGEKYVAERLMCSWKVHFDFSKGTVHRVSIELPDECAGM